MLKGLAKCKQQALSRDGNGPYKMRPSIPDNRKYNSGASASSSQHVSREIGIS